MSTFEWRDLRKGTRGMYRMVERRWVLEYIATKCADAVIKWAHKRLGAVPAEAVRHAPGMPISAYRVYLPYVDAVCVFQDRIELIELKVHDPVKAVAQLIYYRSLAVSDEELRPYLPRPIVPKLVYWRYDAGLDSLCKANGIVYEIHRPAWLEPILREYGYKLT